jgi:hypothetical protein
MAIFASDFKPKSPSPQQFSMKKIDVLIPPDNRATAGYHSICLTLFSLFLMVVYKSLIRLRHPASLFEPGERFIFPVR